MNNSTSARKFCAQPAALMSKGQYFVGTKHPLCAAQGGSLSKNLVAFHQWRGERKSDHFLRRHVRRRKYFSACKRARRSSWADGECAAVRPQTLCQKVFLFDRRNTPCAAAQGVSAMVFFQPSAQRAYRSGYFCDSSASSASQSRGGLSSVHVSGEVLSTRSYSWPLVASCTAA